MDLFWKDILIHAACYGALMAGRKADEKVDENQIINHLDEWPDGASIDLNDDDHVAFARGAIIIGLTINSITSHIAHALKAKEYAEKFERTYGTDAPVYISKELLFECVDGTGITYRELTALMALNSLIGFRRTPVIIRREMVRARALGYKSPKIFHAEDYHEKHRKYPRVPLADDPRKADKTKPQAMTPQQVRDVLTKLVQKGLAVRWIPGLKAKSTYYSTILTESEMLEACKEVAVRREAKKQTYLIGLEQQKEPVKKEPKEPVKKDDAKTPEKEPDDNQTGTKPTTTTGTTEGTRQEPVNINAFQGMPLKGMPLTEMLSTNGPQADRVVSIFDRPRQEEAKKIQQQPEPEPLPEPQGPTLEELQAKLVDAEKQLDEFNSYPEVKAIAPKVYERATAPTIKRIAELKATIASMEVVAP